MFQTAVFDFDRFEAVRDALSSEYIPLNDKTVLLPKLSARLPITNDLPVISILGIEFIQMINGRVYPLGGSNTHPCAVINVDY